MKQSRELKRPGDVFHPDFLEGKPAYFDISIRNSLLPQFIINSATHAGSAAAAGELEKDDKYDKDVSVSVDSRNVGHLVSKQSADFEDHCFAECSYQQCVCQSSCDELA